MASSTQDIDVEPEAGTKTAETTESGSGLDSNVAGTLSYLFGFVSGLIFYLIEREDPFVRWHAAQSMAFSGVLVAAYVVLTFLGTVVSVATFSGSTGGFLVGSLFSLLLGLVWLVVAVGGVVVWAYLMVKTYQEETPRLPIAAKIADRLA
ncbi:DUF4870 domain-containing protein [Halococcus agarilyticus]|uniref:DUF4870 domain-containing protein n=1 Tax=Halococcus agarilyticus TaxID=1232219 RepID=UPI0006779C57|nr:DUF4870 domain-containing protein [Halococcus agarilyticus]